MQRSVDPLIGKQRQAVESVLSALPLDGRASEPLRAAMRHSLADHDRLAAMLVLATGDAVSADTDLAVRSAIVVELWRACTRSHDRFSGFCRQRESDVESGSVRFGDTLELLAGHAHIARAFEVLSAPGPSSPEARNALALLFSRALGGNGLAAEQAMLLRRASNGTEGAALRDACLRTTSIQFCTAIRMGLCSGVTRPQDAAVELALTDFAQLVAIAWNVVHDIAQACRWAQTGWGLARRPAAGSYVGLLGLDSARRYLQRIRYRAGAALERCPLPAVALERVAQHVFDAGLREPDDPIFVRPAGALIFGAHDGGQRMQTLVAGSVATC